MKILITGGAGYIGSVTAAKLQEAGHTVTVLDSLIYGLDPVLPEGVRFINGSLAELEQHISQEDGIEAVVHMGGLIAAGESMKEPDKYWEVNTVGSLRLLEAMRRLDINQLVFSSTAACYGNPVHTPILETDPTAPTNTYGATKLALDFAITSYVTAYGLAAISLRYFNVAGAYGRFGERHQPETHIIPLALQAAAEGRPFTLYGDDYPTEDGTCVRDYIHVADLADAHVLALGKLESGKHTIINLGNSKGSSNRDVVAAVERVTGHKLELTMAARREGDPAILIASNAKAAQILGWKPAKSLDDMVADAWRYFKA